MAAGGRITPTAGSRNICDTHQTTYLPQLVNQSSCFSFIKTRDR
jgi:hypothetical protein